MSMSNAATKAAIHPLTRPLRVYIADSSNGPARATAMGGIPVLPTPIDVDLFGAQQPQATQLGKVKRALTVQLDVDVLEQNKALDAGAGRKIRALQALTDEAPGAVAARAPLEFALGISKANAARVATALRLPKDARLGHLGQVEVLFRNAAGQTPAAARACVAASLVAGGITKSRASALANVWENVTRSIVATAI